MKHTPTEERNDINIIKQVDAMNTVNRIISRTDAVRTSSYPAKLVIPRLDSHLVTHNYRRNELWHLNLTTRLVKDSIQER